MTSKVRERTTQSAGTNPQKREVSVRGRSVEYLVAGGGEPVVLLHGLSGSSRWWWRNMPEIARRYSVYVVDLPGFGAMRRDQAGFVLSEAADWLAEWIRALDLGPVHLVAHSLGGYIGIQLAISHPDLVNRLVLVAPAGVPEDRPLLRYSVSLLRAAKQLRPRFALVLTHDFFRAGPRTILRAARELLSQDAQEDLRRITQPTLLIWGAEDPMIPATIGTVFRSEIANARLLIFDGVGHVPMIDRFDEFNSSVIAFLNGEQVGT